MEQKVVKDNLPSFSDIFGSANNKKVESIDASKLNVLDDAAANKSLERRMKASVTKKKR